MIEFRDVGFTYGGSTEPVLRNVSLRIRDGETVVLCGESGCGKSTLTRLVNGLIPHFHDGELTGEVLLDGRPIGDTALHELAGRVGSVFQNPRTQFYNVDSTAELAFGCENLGLDPAEIERRIVDTSTRLRLDDLLNRSLFDLSGGEKQRIACGSVDTVRPEILVLDEPSSNLDLGAIEHLAAAVRRWRDDGRTLVIAEHRTFYLTDLADRFLYLKNGRIVAEYTPDQFRALSPTELAELGLRDPDPWRRPPAAAPEPSTESVRIRDFTRITDGRRRLAIDRLDLPRGGVIGVLGRNGAGKTTFARTFCALDRGSRGTVEIGGETYRPRRRRRLAYLVMQDVNHQLFTEDVLSEIVLSMDDDGPAERERAREILRAVDLADEADRHPLSLSGGEKQRVAVGGALAADREIMILDEPTSGLDHRRMAELADILRALSAAGTTVLVITHDVELILRCTTHLVYLEAGRVVRSSPMDDDEVTHLQEFLS
ncbi:MAG: ABC transporter ATP-binding protein [Gordonia sp. (in: high G+C Gram-positive bacteria)]|uniref:ABC transporter ATP-binding protein n=1 Tax=Gordonia sp. (in: high G+C Gram-positive bacteria) TaxID=84139 RepID=UPI0039E4C861